VSGCNFLAGVVAFTSVAGITIKEYMDSFMEHNLNDRQDEVTISIPTNAVQIDTDHREAFVL
jgi:transcriptional regulator of met regulon